jgi:predicted nucleotidyltransferase component of viral defense system
MSDSITTVDVNAWIEKARQNPAEHRVRRVMRIVLFAVADSPLLKSKMVIKGGVLLALKYGTHRHTRDLDFSTEARVQQENPAAILDELIRALDAAARAVDDAIRCKVQSHKMLPPREDASFPTLCIKVGYAVQGDKDFQRMVHGRDSSQTVTIDLSFNEKTCIISKITLDDHSEIAAYSLFEQIAEKYRALIQQTSDRRDRIRRQDAYDIFRVIENGYLASRDDKVTLLDTIEQKFSARNISAAASLIEELEIAERSQKEYDRLKDEIDGELPAFDQAFRVVKDFYLSLPWPESA